MNHIEYFTWSHCSPHRVACKGLSKLIVSFMPQLHDLLKLLSVQRTFLKREFQCCTTNCICTALLLVYTLNCTLIILLLSGQETQRYASIVTDVQPKHSAETQQQASTGYITSSHTLSCLPFCLNILEQYLLQSAVRSSPCHSREPWVFWSTISTVQQSTQRFQITQNVQDSRQLSVHFDDNRTSSLASQQQLLSQHFHYVLLVQYWATISPNSCFVNKLSCKPASLTISSLRLGII